MKEKSKIRAIYIGVVAILALVSLSLIMGGGMMGGWGMMGNGSMMNGYGGGWGWNQGSLWMVVIGCILMVIFWGAVIYGVVAMMRRSINGVKD